MGSAFIAYPSNYRILTESILTAVELCKSQGISLVPWQKMNIIGHKIDDLIRQHLFQVDVLIADITFANPNVFYELGFAAGAGKQILPIVNGSLVGANKEAKEIGLFDTIGWFQYINAEDLSKILTEWPNISWTEKYRRKQNYSQPLFILDSAQKVDFRNYIFHAVDNSSVNYRTYDPIETPRLTAAQAISEISSSAGVIIPLLSDQIVDAPIHNLRAAFLLGLCHGFSVKVLCIQYENTPIPLDYRNFVNNSASKRETERRVGDFCQQVLIWNQRGPALERNITTGIINEIDLGSPTAENENLKLSEYFISTAEFLRALRAEGAVVTGRKGSGKSAVYFQAASTIARDTRNCVVDLRPASHNLSRMREELLSVVSVGVFDHTVAAFWQYIIYVEIILKLREMALPKARNNFSLQERIREIEDRFSLDESVVSGDFTSRLQSAVDDVIAEATSSGSETILHEKLTNAMFQEPIPRLREAVASLSDIANHIALFIDDLDKGWPPRQVEPHDIAMVKHLIEVLTRIKRDLGRRKVDFKHLLFLRSDIYENLVEATSDRGKYNVIPVDWSDRLQLERLLRQRVISRVEAARQEEAWQAVNTVMSNGDTAVQRMISNSLRRPRFLIDLCERSLSVAINRGHEEIFEEDVEEGLRQMSLYLVSDFAYEMRDVAGTPEDIFYHFIGISDLITVEEIAETVQESKIHLSIEDTVNLLLWYGFIGIQSDDGEPVFIYDRAYDFRRLEAERSKLGNDILYRVNPAFLRGLR